MCSSLKVMALSAATTIAAIGCAAAGDGYYLRCVPQETRTASDRLVAVNIHLLDSGNFDKIIYFAANGAYYDRAKRYNGAAFHDESGFFWKGRLRSDSKVEIIGHFDRYESRLRYTETIRDVTKSSEEPTFVVSDCGADTLPASAATLSPRIQSDATMSRDIDAYLACVNKAVVTLAIATPDRADDVIAAARGLCFQERSAIVTRANALGLNGDEEAKAGDATIHDSLVARALLARATAAHPGAAQDQSTPVKQHQY